MVDVCAEELCTGTRWWVCVRMERAGTQWCVRAVRRPPMAGGCAGAHGGWVHHKVLRVFLFEGSVLTQGSVGSAMASGSSPQRTHTHAHATHRCTGTRPTTHARDHDKDTQAFYLTHLRTRTEQGAYTQAQTIIGCDTGADMRRGNKPHTPGITLIGIAHTLNKRTHTRTHQLRSVQ